MHNLLYIDGEWTGEALEKLLVHNPATGELISEVPKGGKKEAVAAIEAADDAFKIWSKTTAFERAKLLKRFYELMIENETELAELMTSEMGKPLSEARGEVHYAANYIEWYAEEAKRVYGETIPTHDSNKRLQLWKKPVGVVAAITPWNFPAAMLTRKMGPALAAGCTIVIKPSSETPLTAIKLVQLAEEAGFPKGVINIVIGSSSEIGEALLLDSRVRKVTFTGSTEVGKILMKQGSETIKKLSLELGGHAPIIVLDDADINRAVAGTIASKFRNSGQTCVCGNRIYVQSKIYNKFIDLLTERVRELKVGNGMAEGVNIGPLINKAGVEKVSTHVSDALEKGAQLVYGGKQPSEKGNYYLPTIIKDATNDMLMMNEETFGPVAPIQKFETIDEVVHLANDTPFGLAAYVFTESISNGTRIIEEIDFGIVGWNDGAPSAVQAPFGGLKESGLGREGGHQGMDEFLEMQYVSIGI
ncbi:NAD-dependent succinate-semialdehyde dehydrogenase [Salinicoccus halitifaciens]|uniref:Succinate-semialdehyde dehydrogenase/glutarate-semialdehyde dehydrogenase n=1 Tax=Salinicoccus halitifaciens TaxID=1073415 RepID=A0ABV2E8L1_9STAP|nr:NAD-dependent succinate-semialdehyde dehydrogenase [Salinicoccus halitifaciens]MCD2137860.1 NAD-dependent succinate-semialdehyde dehydrogenase [Salinicoccus halitifaciens]